MRSRRASKMAGPRGRFPTVCDEPFDGAQCGGECFAICGLPACVDADTSASYDACAVRCEAVADAEEAAEGCPACETVCQQPPDGTASILCEVSQCEWLCLPGPECGAHARCGDVACAAGSVSAPLAAAVSAGTEVSHPAPRVDWTAVVALTTLAMVVGAALAWAAGGQRRQRAVGP